MMGTPFQRELLMWAMAAQKVGHLESLGTESSSLYPGFCPSEDLVYWPMMVSSGLIEAMLWMTRTYIMVNDRYK